LFTRLLLPTDFTPSSQAALLLARENFPTATRRLLHVLDPQRLASDLNSPVSAREEREEAEAGVLAQLDELALPEEEFVVRVGTPVETIIAEADSWEADLIVMGTHGRTGLALFLNGSVAERVVRYSRRPVLIEHERS